MEKPDQAAGRAALWWLLYGNFVIGTGVLMPAGMLNVLAADLQISAATAGLLLLAGGLVVGFGAPVLAGLTSQIDRRKLLAGSAAIFLVGHAGAAIATDFWPLLIIRTLGMIAAALFTPQAAATIALLVPAEQRSKSIAFIFIGWSAASVAGIPLATLLASHFGWRAAFLAVAVLSAVAMLGVWRSLKPGLRVEPLRLASWLSVFSNPLLLCLLLTTMLSMSGQFTLFSYLAPTLREGYGAASQDIALMLAVVGSAGVVGNYFATHAVGRFSLDTLVLALLCMMAVAMVTFGLFFGNLAGAVAASLLWGAGSFSSNSLMQSRLIAAAPALAAATVALNTSAVYLGQSLGAAAGGALVTRGIDASLMWTAALFLTLAIATSLVASRLKSAT